ATRAFLQIAIGVFMLGSALRMLNVHPIFRYFAFEPPAFLRRKLRRTASAADSSSLAAPAFLGFLTVLIPCGITQAMMAAALGTGSPVQGAALMFAFTLGASPVFFAVAYFATQLGARLEKHFMRFVAVVVLVLAVVTIDSGITLAGSPVSLTRLINGARAGQASATDGQAVSPPVAAGPQSPAAEPAGLGENVITVTVTNYGYEPGVVHAKAGEPVQLRLVSQDVYSCSLAFIIPALEVQEFLPQTGEVLIDIPAQTAGTQIPFMCSMGMFTGTIIFDL
ncbi:MAG TPA: sulfite exporter TauE/SafE family protein, partial [Anaerolineaceae bacterium]|nr:sulfite exporter TauE/SafE family protein [Anaerolineaceae bacterium]